MVDLLLIGEVISRTFLNSCFASFLKEFYSSYFTSFISFLISRLGFFFENESADNYLILIVVYPFNFFIFSPSMSSESEEIESLSLDYVSFALIYCY